MKRIKFHRAELDALPLPPAGKRGEYKDEDAPELILRVTSNGTKTFCVRRKLHGSVVRVTLGTYMRPGDTESSMTVGQARKKAAKAKAKLVDGENPNATKRAGRVAGLTLREMLDAYIEDNSDLKPSTAVGYRAVLNEVMSDWMDAPLRDVTDERVLTRLKRHGLRSHARANQGMRVLRCVWNYAMTYNPANGVRIYGDNPVLILTARKVWFRVDRRRTRIKDRDLPSWYAGVRKLQGSKLPGAADVGDVLTVLLYTGLRPIEVSGLQWRDVDLVERTIGIPDPKNRKPHELPIPLQLVDLFEARQARGDDNAYVFGSTRDPAKPFGKPLLHKYVRILKDETGVDFIPYDLRRNFATIADRLDISALATKRLLNHKTQESDDVTAGYVVSETVRLADAMQKIADKIAELVTAKPDNVVAIRAAS